MAGLNPYFRMEHLDSKYATKVLLCLDGVELRSAEKLDIESSLLLDTCIIFKMPVSTTPEILCGLFL